jgi:SAM-dependent methyltransferase
MNELEKGVERYYSQKITEYGATPQGVDWNGEASQNIRFDALTKIINRESFSILDYGCGYGALLTFLTQRHKQFRFFGYDLSVQMIDHAKKIHKSSAARWSSSKSELSTSDFVIASGIFNVKQDTDVNGWTSYVIETLHQIDSLSTYGFAVNLLTVYSDSDKMKPHLYYADPLFLFDYAKKNFSKSVAILHDYPLYEFTLLVRKNII